MYISHQKEPQGGLFEKLNCHLVFSPLINLFHTHANSGRHTHSISVIVAWAYMNKKHVCSQDSVCFMLILNVKTWNYLRLIGYTFKRFLRLCIGKVRSSISFNSWLLVNLNNILLLKKLNPKTESRTQHVVVDMLTTWLLVSMFEVFLFWNVTKPSIQFWPLKDILQNLTLHSLPSDGIHTGRFCSIRFMSSASSRKSLSEKTIGAL